MRQPRRRPDPAAFRTRGSARLLPGRVSSPIGLMSGMSNILMLTGAIFMLEIYDRVLPSRSVPTLVALVILAAGLFAAQGLLDLIRGRILVRIGSRLDEALSGRVYETIVRLPLKVGNRTDGLQPLRDLDSVRILPVGPGPDRAVRPAVAADLSRHLLCCSIPTSASPRWSARSSSACLTLMTEIMTREPTQSRDRVCHHAQRARRSEPAQRRGADGDGHDRRASPRSGTMPIASTWRASSAPATWRAASARSPRCCA